MSSQRYLLSAAKFSHSWLTCRPNNKGFNSLQYGALQTNATCLRSVSNQIFATGIAPYVRLNCRSCRPAFVALGAGCKLKAQFFAQVKVAVMDANQGAAGN